MCVFYIPYLSTKIFFITIDRYDGKILVTTERCVPAESGAGVVSTREAVGTKGSYKQISESRTHIL